MQTYHFKITTFSHCHKGFSFITHQYVGGRWLRGHEVISRTFLGWWKKSLFWYSGELKLLPLFIQRRGGRGQNLTHFSWWVKISYCVLRGSWKYLPCRLKLDHSPLVNILEIFFRTLAKFWKDDQFPGYSIFDPGDLFMTLLKEQKLICLIPWYL